MSIPGKTLSPAERIFFFSTAYTFEEYLCTIVMYRSMVQTRYWEVRLSPVDQGFFVTYPDIVHMLVIAADDSPDTIAVLPILARIAAASPRIDLRILHDDDENWARLTQVVDDPEVSDNFAEIDPPMLVLLDSEWQFLEHWGPHPDAAEMKLDAWLERYPEYESLAADESSDAQETYTQLLDKLVYDMRIWYNSGLDDACVAEIRQVFAGLLEDDGNGADED